MLKKESILRIKSALYKLGMHSIDVYCKDAEILIASSKECFSENKEVIRNKLNIARTFDLIIVAYMDECVDLIS